ncbi:MAG: type II toxin-antitoxin system VapC family toxin [Gemmatimonadetes bacterium]|jgi:tRNA(fMet)-specific endonuclease VapC|nr:type II toxin-antitoxin system VapC family toxin [Gemmatimonadota bacterium]MBP6668243.1 type II toxin-antitoxin system VapC family toxin [Gemmatimonadales bacterium]MBK6779769.1 type II toxin-antitoxin system VapC family toxin [Gemmatimonadota bacterium]MBK7350503.1 type II toxin-antitoxin system VapC family toxin [Gemmatimonadota bacterium]MBK7785649.1 type II toxin-antitoxin system VapC family toxin [Gemmatimonadota bacterium]
MPPTGRYILDTNILIALLAGEPAALTEAGRAAATFIPTIALGELYYGARKSGRPTENLEVIERLAASAALLPCGPETARRYGEVKAELRAAGTPIPENDIWIAALALEHSLTLVTRDAHFAVVAGITAVPWR